jgi:hypothetical protein
MSSDIRPYIPLQTQIRCPSCPCGTMWYQVAPGGARWCQLAQRWFYQMWKFVGGTSWSRVVSYGTVWYRMVPCGIVWYRVVQLESYGVVWVLAA